MKSPNFHGYSFAIPKVIIKYFSLLQFVLFSVCMFPQQLAFPEATGAASYVTGGRGHSVYHVTNLNDSGAGSFRDAVSSSNRTIVFDVSGTIELTSDLYISSDNITIAGQTAPQGGITITGDVVHFQNINNVIVRYLRFRPDYNPAGNVDALNAYNCNNFIVDHCSISWGGDEAFSITGSSSDVTIQNCISGESATGMLVGNSNSPTTFNFSIIGNLWYNVSHRFPNVHALRTDLINNVVHNWFTRLKAINAEHDVELNEINNYYQSGDNTGEPLDPDWSINWVQSNSLKIYTDGNVRTEYLTEDGDDWSLYVTRFSWEPANPDFQVFTPFPLLGEAPTIMTAAEALANVPLNVGANKYLNSDGSAGEYRDNIDSTYITNVLNGVSENYSYPPTNVVNKQSYIDFHNSVSSTPINVRPSGYDSDQDGMADDWENLWGFNPNDASDNNLDLDNDGYTNIEEFLNGTNPGSNGLNVTLGSDVSICEGESVTLTASVSGGEAPYNYSWSNGSSGSSITVSPDTTTTYDVTVTDNLNDTANSSITVTVNAFPTANAGEDIEICQDETVTLTATGGDSYEWNNGQTTPSIDVDPQETTIYTVTVSSNGCSSTDDVTVTVKPRPSINAGNDVDIYPNESTTLTASGDGTFVWSTGEETQTITVSPSETTTYYVTATLDGCTNTDSVTVNVIQDVIANAGEDVTICQNDTVTLTATGGVTYEWSTGETTQSIEVSPNETTTYTVTVSDPYSSDTDDVVVFVNPLPLIDAGEDLTINAGESRILTATGDGDFLWSTGETTDSITVSPTQTTTYFVTATLNGCSDTDSVTVTVIQDSVTANAGEDVTICEADSVTLTATGGDNYYWSTGETTQSIVVSPNVTTVYTVIVSNQNGSDSDQVIVNVNPVPVADAGEDTTILYGESTTLTATGGSNYLWSTGETTQSITVSPLQNRTYTVEVFENTCSSTDMVNVTVNANANAGENITICQGESATLTATGGSNFLWNTGETTSTINVSPNQTTTYTVTVSNGNSTDQDEVTVNVNLLPNAYAGEDDLIEAGQSITLGASGGNSYLWSTGETSQYISVSPLETTTYTVEAIINGCSSFDEVTISVVEPVSAYAGDNIETCPGEEVTLTASGGLYYEWNTGETTSSIIVYPLQTTEYSVTVSNGINSQTANVVVSVDSCVAMNIDPPESQGFDYKIYPNPSQGELNVKLSGLENISSIYVSDMMGKVIINESFQPENGSLINKYYNLSSLAKGIYFVTLYESGKEAIVKKLILQ